MKTAEEWTDELGVAPSLYTVVDAIQLDAFKAGMEYAANSCGVNFYPTNVQGSVTERAFDYGIREKNSAILTAAQQLKEIPK